MQAMVQPYLKSIDGSGERSIVYFGGKLSHAVKRHPPLSSGLHGGVAIELPADERTFADAVLAAVPEPMLYARVDIARDDAGTLRLMELEVIEPSFFLDVVPEAAGRLADAVLAVTRSIRTGAGQTADAARATGPPARRSRAPGSAAAAAPAWCPARAARR